jgi:hypothetical protein
MKVCRKCKNEYRDDYAYCPKCGTPYDVKKKITRVPGSIFSKSSIEIIKKIWNIILYVFGGLLILIYIISINSNTLCSIFAILFGLSLFQIFYKLISNKVNSASADKVINITRMVLPIVLLVIWIGVTPVDTKTNDKNKQNESSSDTQETSESTNKKENTTESITSIESTVKQEVVYELNYNLLGDYGKIVEYEGTNAYFYYFPSGKYVVELTSKTENICFLWVDYNEGYKDDFGTSYNNKEKLSFSDKGEKHEVSLTDDTHIYNSNDCNYKLTKNN